MSAPAVSWDPRAAAALRPSRAAGGPMSPRLPLRRPGWSGRGARPGRLLGGVCAGLALHLDRGVWRVRAALVLATAMGGAGAILYVLLWVLVPAGDPVAEAAGSIPSSRARLASRPRSLTRLPQGLSALTGGAALLLAALVLALWRAGAAPGSDWLLPLLLLAAGAAVAWSPAGTVTGSQSRLASPLRLIGGVSLAAVGILLWVGADTPPRVLLTGALTGGALVVGLGAVLAPLWLRTNRALADTRAAEAREAERADIAAHLHDSVLQTLTLIRKRAAEPEEVARLARSQERELRAWLYTDRPEAGASTADVLRELVGEIEDRYAAEIDLVVVGDRVPDRETDAVVAAAREALSNAVRHGAPPVSLYAELDPSGIELFVRDHGPGFELGDVAADRHGVRESIIARMARHGGSGTVRRVPGGTEVSLVLRTPVPTAPSGS